MAVVGISGQAASRLDRSLSARQDRVLVPPRLAVPNRAIAGLLKRAMVPVFSGGNCLSRPGTVSARARLARHPTISKCPEMKTNHHSYHEARAEEELALAQSATSPDVVRAHVALAEMHLEIVYDPDSSKAGYANGKA